MPQARSWPEDEIERRSYSFATLIRQAWRVVARTLLQRRHSQGSFTLIDLGNLPELWAQQTDQKIIPQLGMALYDGADKVLLDVNAEPQWEIFEDFVEKYLNAATNRLVDIGDDVWGLVQQQLLTGYGLGEDYSQLAARIHHTTGVSDARALLIARTEMHAALEAGSYEQALLVDPDGKKTWMSTHDDRTRETHREANDQVVLLNEPFMVGGSPLRFPGDPLGEPGEVIRCRCSVVYTLGETVTSSHEDDSISLVSDEVMATAAGARKFTEAAHPRGNDGKFISKGSTTYEILTGTHLPTSYAIMSISQSDWDKLTPKQREKIRKVAKSVDAQAGTDTQNHVSMLEAKSPTKSSVLPSTTSTNGATTQPAAPSGHDIPSSVDAVPGDIYKQHPDGHIVAMSADGQERLRWSAPQKKYLRQKKSTDGTWVQSGPPLIKKAAYDFLMGKKGTSEAWRKSKKSSTSPPKTAITPAAVPSTKDLLTAPKTPITPDVTPSASPFKVLSEEERGKSGDGYAAPGLWGRYGAAGVMIRSVGDDGKPRYLLVQRGPMVSSNKGKWQLPGGAIDEHETPEQGAAREIFEEIGAPQAYLDSMEHKGTHATEVPVPGQSPWVYSNIAADAPDMFAPKVDGSETSDAQWLTREEIEHLAAIGVLHPALAKNLKNVFDLYDGSTAPSVETPKDAAPKSESVTPAGVGVHLNVDAPIPLGHLKKISGQGGSNAGGTYEAPDGKRYYVKKAKTKNHARNEVLAAQLYTAAGIETPPVSAGEGIPDLGSGVHTYTPLVPGAQQDLSSKLKDPTYRAKIRDGFAVDAWLANWDVAGQGYDNIITDENGNPVRIDVGGSILYRAQGGEKGSSFGDTVSELDTLRDASINPTAAKIFGGMTDDEIRQSAAHLEAVTPEQIDKMVADAGLPQSLAETLKKRRDYILKKYPPTTGQKPTAVTTPDATITPQVTPPTPATSTLVSGVPTPITDLHNWPSLGANDWKSIDLGGNLYDDGQVVAQTADGDRKITYDAAGNQYLMHSWSASTQEWITSPFIVPDGGLSAFEFNDIADWYLPKDTQLTPYAPNATAPSVPSAPSKTFWQPEHEIYWGTVTNDAESGFIDDGDVVAVSSDGSLRVRYSHNTDQFVVARFDTGFGDWIAVDNIDIHTGDIDAEMQQALSMNADDYNSSWLTPDAFDPKENPSAPSIPHMTAMLAENATLTPLKSWEIWDLHAARPTAGLVLAHAITDTGDTWEAKSGGPSGGVQIFKNGTKFATEKNSVSFAAFIDANQHIKWQKGPLTQTTPSSPSLAVQSNLVKFTDSHGNVDWNALTIAAKNGEIPDGTIVAHTTDGKLRIVTQDTPSEPYILVQLKNQDGSWHTLESAFVSELEKITADYAKATSGGPSTDWQVSPFTSTPTLGVPPVAQAVTPPVPVLGPDNDSIINFWPGVDVPGKYGDGEVVAQSKSGNSKIVWNAQTNKYDRLDWYSGNWNNSYSYDLGYLDGADQDAFFDWYIPDKTTPATGVAELLTSDKLPKTTDDIDIDDALAGNLQVSGPYIATQANVAKEGDVIAVGVSTTGSGTKWRAVKKKNGSVDFQHLMATSAEWSTIATASKSSEIVTYGSSPAIKWVQPTAVAATPTSSNAVGFIPNTTFTPGFHGTSVDHDIDHDAIFNGDDVPELPQTVETLKELIANVNNSDSTSQVLAYGNDGSSNSRLIYSPIAHKVRVQRQNSIGDWVTVSTNSLDYDTQSTYDAILHNMGVQADTWKSAWNAKTKTPSGNASTPQNVVGFTPSATFTPGLHATSSDDMVDIAAIIDGDDVPNMPMTVDSIAELLNYTDFTAGPQVLAYGGDKKSRIVYNPAASEVQMQFLTPSGKWSLIAWTDASDASSDPAAMLHAMELQSSTWKSAWNSKVKAPGSATTSSPTSPDIQAQQLAQTITAKYSSASYGDVLHATHDNDGNEILFTRVAPYIRVTKNGVLTKNIHNSDDQALIDYIKSIQPGSSPLSPSAPPSPPSVYSVPVSITGMLHTPSIAAAVNNGSYGDIIATGEDANGEKYQLRVGSGHTLRLFHDNGNGHYYAYSSMGLLSPSSDLNYLFNGISSGKEHEDIKWEPGPLAPSEKKPTVPTPPTSTAPSSLPTAVPQITFPDGTSHAIGEQIKTWGPLTAKSQWKKPLGYKPTIIAATKDGNYRIVLTSGGYYRREKYNHSTKSWESEAAEKHKLAPLGKGKTWFKVGGPNGAPSGTSSASSTPSGPTATHTSAQPPSIPAGTGSFPTGPGDISHLSDADKKAMYAHFRTFNVYSSGDDFAMFKAVKATADKYNISLMQALRVIDEQRMVKNGYATNEHKYENKMTAWLQTPQGFAFATTGKKLKPPLPPQPTFLAGIDPNKDIPTFEDSDHYKYEILPTIDAATAWWDDTKSAGGMSGVPWTTSQKASLKAWTGGIYGSMNKWLYEGKDTSDSHKNHVKNAQLGMRPSTKPVLLHRGAGLDAFGVSSHAELEQLVGSTLVQDGFGASSVGGTAAFSGMPMLIEIEAPPGTPMAWVAPFSNYGTSEREMLLAAGLYYRIISVKKGPYGQSVARVRIVPKPAGV